MTVRHLTCRNNVDEDGYLRDNQRVHHGTLGGGVIAALAGPVDPTTHDNLDYPDHELGECVVTEELEEGSPIVWTEDERFMMASPRPGTKQRLGRVNMGARRAAWLQQFTDKI